MMTSPLSAAQASMLCQDYQQLTGSIFDKGSLGKGYIECVAIAPFEESKQWLFAQYYREYRDAQKALKFYHGTEFDVIVLSIPFLRKRGILFKSLREYIQENNLPFQPARYTHVEQTEYHYLRQSY